MFGKKEEGREGFGSLEKEIQLTLTPLLRLFGYDGGRPRN